MKDEKCLDSSFILHPSSFMIIPRTSRFHAMMKCPFCHFDNEDGALFCEQCKSDLASTPIPVPALAEPIELEAMPASALPEAMPVVAVAEPPPVPAAHATPVEPIPVVAPPMVEAAPIALEAAPVQQAEPVAAAAAPPPLPQAVAPPVQAAPAPAAPAEQAPALPPGAQPRLLVLRGQKRNVEYPIYDGLNFIGRADEKPVDIDLEDQEPPDRIWCSRQHAVISFENDQLTIEDLNSSNGTYVNRSRIYPGQKRPLAVNDIIQIGNVQLKVIV
jgi:pSer/pThr/pTyr-binding forkhead associated (FHA) protein